MAGTDTSRADLLDRLFAGQGEGFFVDVGAGDGAATEALSAKGWRGVNLEPDRKRAAALAARRSGDVTLAVAVAAGGEATLWRPKDDRGLGTTDVRAARELAASGRVLKERKAPARSLNSLMATYAPPTVDLLVVDFSGDPGPILATLNLGRHRPRAILLAGGGSEALAATLQTARYRLAAEAGVDRLWLREEDPSLGADLPPETRPVRPANPLEAEVSRQAEAIATLRAAADARAAIVAERDAELVTLQATMAEQAEVAAFNRRLAEGRAQTIARQREALETLESGATSAEAELRSTRAALKAAEGRASLASSETREVRSALRTAEASAAERVRDLETELKTVRMSLAEAERLAVERADEAAALRSNAAAAMEENDVRVRLVEDQAAENAALSEQLSVALRWSEVVREDRQANYDRAERLVAMLADSEARSAELRAQLEARAAEAAALAQRLEHVRADGLALARQVRDLRERLHGRDGELAASRAATAAAEATASEATARADEGRLRLHRAEQALTAAETEAAVLRMRAARASAAADDERQARGIAEKAAAEALSLANQAGEALGATRADALAASDDARRERAAAASALSRLKAQERRVDEVRFAGPGGPLAAWAKGPLWRFLLTVAYQARPPRRLEPPKRITVVTPVFSAVDTVRDTIESVLAQDYPELEYIVVDGGSTDGTLDLLRSYGDRVDRLISEPDEGMYDAVAKGFAYATGDILCYLNADDAFEPGALKRVDAAFGDMRKRQVVYFEDDVLVQGWKFPNITQPHLDHTALLRGHIVSQDGVFFSRRAYDHIYGLDRTLRYAGDWDLWVRLSDLFRFHRVAGHVSSFQVRARQLSGDMVPYDAERADRRAWRESVTTPWDRFRRGWSARVTSLRNAWDRRVVQPRRAFHYPIDFWEMPAVAAEGPRPPVEVRAASDRSEPDALMTSRVNPRFGPDRVSWLYRHEAADWVSVHPPIPPEERIARREAALQPAAPPTPSDRSLGGSPYREWKGGRGRHRGLAEAAPDARGRRHAGPYALAEARAEAVEQALGGRLGGRLLDVGSGHGLLLDRMRERGCDVTGCEVAPSAVEACRSRGHVMLDGPVDRLAQRFDGEPLDIVLVDELTEHFVDPLAALVQLASLLSVGGRLVLTAPNLDATQREIFGPTWSLWHSSDRRHYFGRKGLDDMATAAGLSVARYATFSTVADSWLTQAVRRHGIGLNLPMGVHTPPPGAAEAEALAGFARATFDPKGGGDRLCAVLTRETAG